MADSKLMNAVGTCDGTNYQDHHRANLVEYCVLEDIEHVLHTPCPAPITATLAPAAEGLFLPVPRSLRLQSVSCCLCFSA